MNKIFRTVMAAVLAIGILFSVTACGTSTEGERPAGTKIVIYKGSTLVERSNDTAVKKAIEEKFWKDTGISLDIRLELKTKADFNSVMGVALATSSWDAAVSYIGVAGIDDLIMREGYAKDITQLLNGNDYPNLKKQIKADDYVVSRSTDGKIYGLPSIKNTKKYGVLVRTDLIEKAGYTLRKGNPDGLKTVVTINDFENMLYELKNVDGVKNPLVAYPWDIEQIITGGVTGSAHYTDSYKVYDNDKDGVPDSILPNTAIEEYQYDLEYMYKWQKDGLWEANANIRPLSDRLSDMVTGRAAIYCVNPEITNLISVARQVKSIHSEYEFDIMDPLRPVDAAGNLDADADYGFKEDKRNYDCLVFNPRSQNTELILKYFDWMYSSVENYELCAYGIEGTDWVRPQNDTTTYSYPADKADEFIRKPNYSQGYTIIQNDDFCYRALDSYNEQEKGWVQKTLSAKTIANAIPPYYFSKAPKAAEDDRMEAFQNIYAQSIMKAWAATADPKTTYPTYRAAYLEKAAASINHMLTEYKMFTL